MSTRSPRAIRAARRQDARRQRNGLDGEQLDIGRARLRMSPDPLILECGANTGTDTQAFLDRWPTSRIICFEPEPRAIATWRAMVTSPRAALVEVALAESDGTATFHRSSGRPPVDTPESDQPWNQSGSLRRPTGHLEIWPWVEFTETMTVETRSLDSWATEHAIGPVDLVWADVQGAEGDVVRGGQRTLSRARYLYIETSETEYYEGQVTTAELLSLLPDWRVLARFTFDVLLENRRWRRFGRR